MSSINRVALSGNLGADMEVRSTSTGAYVGEFSLAISEWGKDGERTSWVRCTMFGDRAQKLAPYLVKGTKVALSGRLHQSVWETQAGEKRSRVGVIVDEIEFMSRQPQPQAQAYAQPAAHGAQATVQSAFPGAKVEPVYADDDLPF